MLSHRSLASTVSDANASRASSTLVRASAFWSAANRASASAKYGTGRSGYCGPPSSSSVAHRAPQDSPVRRAIRAVCAETVHNGAERLRSMPDLVLVERRARKERAPLCLLAAILAEGRRQSNRDA